jgi:hypothetical protein
MSPKRPGGPWQSPRTMTDGLLRRCQQEASVLGDSGRSSSNLLAFNSATCILAPSATELPQPTRHLVIEIPPTRKTGQVKTWKKSAPFLPAILCIAISARARSRREEKTEMSTPTVSRLLLMSFVTLALACAPKPAFGQHHGRGSHGGGGSHHSGSRGGGGGFHGGHGHFGGKSFGRAMSAAPRQRGGGSARSFSGLGSRAKSNSAYLGGRSGRSNWPTNARSTSRSWSGQGQSSWATTPRSTSSFNSNRLPIAGSASRSWAGQGQSSWARTPRSMTSFNSNWPPSTGSGSRSWPGQGQSSWANTPRSIASFNSNRAPIAGSGSRSWAGQRQSSWARTPRSISSSNSNRPPTAGSGSRSWSGSSQSLSASLLNSRLSFNPNHRQSNSGNSRFGNSTFGHSSFSNSRFGSRVPRDGSSRFDGAHHFDSGTGSFNQDSSFGGGDFSFLPDLLGLALNLGRFAVPGLGLLGSGLGGLGEPALGLLGSGLASFSQDAGLESQQWGPGQAFNSTPNLTCPQ